MTKWVPDRAALKRPVYRSLVNHIIRAVQNGRVAPGERLPTHRQLARELGISIQTVSRAYEELTRRGTIVGEVGRGTFVRPGKAEPVQPFVQDRDQGQGGLIDLSILKPVGGAIHVERMRAALGALQADLPGTALFSFRPSLAHRRYREAATGWLRLCGLEVQPGAVQITNGATPAITTALLSAVPGGGLVVTEAIGHHPLRPLAGYLGFRLKGLEIDDDGIVPAAFEAACRAAEVKALFIVPSAGNPTLGMTSLPRREAIVETARRHNVLIVENDAWGPLVEGRPPPIASLAPERTFYVTSFTKCTMPGLRTGYLVAPDALSASVANRHLATNWSATSIVAEIASRWIADGTARELLDWQRATLASRHRVAAQILGDLPYRHHPNSLHIWLPLPPPWREAEFVAHARLNNVAVAPGASFATDASVKTSAVRISVGSTSTDELRLGLEVVARLAHGEPEPALLAI